MGNRNSQLELTDRVRLMSKEQLRAEYDIEILGNGRVRDFIDGVTYFSLHEWAADQLNVHHVVKLKTPKIHSEYD